MDRCVKSGNPNHTTPATPRGWSPRQRQESAPAAARGHWHRLGTAARSRASRRTPAAGPRGAASEVRSCSQTTARFCRLQGNSGKVCQLGRMGTFLADNLLDVCHLPTVNWRRYWKLRKIMRRLVDSVGFRYRVYFRCPRGLPEMVFPRLKSFAEAAKR